MADLRGVGRVAIAVVGAAAAVAVGFVLFVVLPGTATELAGVVLAVVVGLAGSRVAGNVAASVFPDYDVAEVSVEGPIARDGTPPVPGGGRGTPVDAIVDQIERADADGAVDALLVKLNTPGGEVVPSDDVRQAAADFDGPTVAYATDTCASGGYWIASGCDELWARDASVVGSIGVIGSRVDATDLAEKVGVEYDRYAAGKYKDAGLSIKETSDDEREYLQGIVDGFYEDFVERVAEGREMDPAAVRDTEARVYLGADAHDLGLVDHLGDRDDVEASVAERLGRDSVSVREFEPSVGITQRLRGGATAVAYAAGAGAAGVLAGDERPLRLR